MSRRRQFMLFCIIWAIQSTSPQPLPLLLSLYIWFVRIIAVRHFNVFKFIHRSKMYGFLNTSNPTRSQIKNPWKVKIKCYVHIPKFLS
jgi:hypothetical protein